MPESQPSPAPSSGEGSAPGAPLLDPNALVATFVAVLKAPVEFFKSIKDEKGFQKCLVFSVAMMVVSGVLMAIWDLLHGLGGGWAVRSLVQAAVSGLVGPFIGGAIIWVACLIFGSKAPYDHSARISGYATAVAPAASLCLLVPFIGWLAAVVIWLYGLYIVVMGARTLNFEPRPPEAAAPPPGPAA